MTGVASSHSDADAIGIVTFLIRRDQRSKNPITATRLYRSVGSDLRVCWCISQDGSEGIGRSFREEERRKRSSGSYIVRFTLHAHAKNLIADSAVVSSSWMNSTSSSLRNKT